MLLPVLGQQTGVCRDPFRCFYGTCLACVSSLCAFPDHSAPGNCQRATSSWILLSAPRTLSAGAPTTDPKINKAAVNGRKARQVRLSKGQVIGLPFCYVVVDRYPRIAIHHSSSEPEALFFCRRDGTYGKNDDSLSRNLPANSFAIVDLSAPAGLWIILGHLERSFLFQSDGPLGQCEFCL